MYFLAKKLEEKFHLEKIGEKVTFISRQQKLIKIDEQIQKLNELLEKCQK